MDFTTDPVNEFLHLQRRDVNDSQDGVTVYGRYEFLKTRTLLATPIVVIIAAATLVGTLGNALIITVICSNKLGKNVTTMFILNLAISDMFVTLIVDPMSLIGKYTLCCLD